MPSKISEIRVLLVEDNPDDAALLIRELERSGLQTHCVRVDTEPAYVQALESEIDIVIADMSLPEFSGVRALEVLNQTRLEIPFIVVTGSMGEDAAMEMLRLGAADYLLKDRLARLGRAVRNILEQSRMRLENRTAHAALFESTERFLELIDNIDQVFWMTNLEKTKLIFVSPAYERIWGLPASELYKHPSQWFAAVHEDDRAKVEAASKAPTEKPYDMEYRIVRPDGEIRWIHDRIFPIRGPDSRPVRWAGVSADITQRRKAEDELRTSEQKYKELADNATDIVWVLDIATEKFTYFSPSVELIRGFTPDEALRFPLSETLTPESYREAGEIIARELADNRTEAGPGKPRVYNFQELRKDGSAYPAETRLRFLRDSSGKPFAIQGITRDITDRVAAEERVRRLNADLAEAQRVARVGSWEWDFTTNLVQWTHECANLLGLPVETTVPSFEAFLELVPGESRARVRSTVEDGMEAGIPFEFEQEIVRPSGDRRWMHVLGEPIRDNAGSVCGFRGTVQDISEAYRAAETLRESQRRFSDMMANVQLASVMLDRHAQITYCNDYFLKLTGQKMEDVIGQDWFTLFAPNDSPEIRKRFRDLLASGVNTRTHENQILVKSGGTRLIRWSHGILRSPSGEAVGTASIGEDITAQRETESRLRLQSSALEAAANAIVITDSDGRIEWVNPAFTKATGYSAEEALGHKPGDLIKSGEHEAHFYESMMKTISGKKVWHGEVINRSKDGRLIPFEMTITPVLNEKSEVTHFVAVQQDISKRKALEEELRQSQKLEAIGRLSGGVAHDFNNLLTVILGHVALLETCNLDEEGLDSVRAIERAGKRAADLTRQLLLFARRQSMQMRPVNLDQTIEQTIKMLRRILGEDVQLEFKHTEGDLTVLADPGMLDQVLMNLSVNARDAMPNGGKLLIETFPVTLRDDTSTGRTGRFALLTVTDSGAGIPPEILPKIFDPFFTTKETGKGTGLGLATVFGIIQQHGGWVHAESRQGEGARFSVYLPLIRDPAESDEVQQKKAPDYDGTETLLVVEDEEGIRQMLEKFLSLRGYRVITAESGPQALDAWKKEKNSIDLVLTDIVMPGGMNGVELGKLLLHEKPDVKCIYSSGYSDLLMAGDLSLEDGVNFIPKPYVLDKVGEIIRFQLDAKGKKVS